MRHKETKMKKRDDRGEGNYIAIVLFLAAFIMMAGIITILRMRIITADMRDAVQAAVTSLAQENWDNTYKGRREGYSGAYVTYGSGTWYPDPEYEIDAGSVAQRIAGLTGASYDPSTGYYATAAGGERELEFHVADTVITNTPLTPGNAYSNFTADVTVHIRVPWGMRFPLPPLELDLKCRAAYMPKF